MRSTAAINPIRRFAGRRSPRRPGLTLYEVMISLAILLPALAVLGQAIAHGGRAAMQATRQTEAAIRCDSVISEVISGAYPLTPVTGSLFPDGAAGWSWDLQVLDGPYAGLLMVEVTVRHVGAAGQVDVTTVMNRLLRDPQLYAAAAAASASSAVPGSSASGTAPLGGSQASGAPF